MALTENRKTFEREPKHRVVPVAAATTIFAGGMTAISAAGFARPPGAAGDAVIGRAEERVENAGGNGEATVRIAAGCFLYANSAGADEIALSDIGADCFAVDDEAVAKTNGGNTRPVAGRIFDVDAEGVWVVQA